MTSGTTDDAQLVDYKRDAPDGYRALAALTRAGAIDLHTVELVKIRASQINRCTHCIETHERVARDAGVSGDRLAALAAWWESDLFDARERAALALTEAVTRIEGGIPADVMAEASRHFPEPELTRLVLAIIAINGWNRAWIATGR
jgi:AhpD family alkylhydroperoxidase